MESGTEPVSDEAEVEESPGPNKVVSLILVGLVAGFAVFVPGVGAIGAFLVAIVATFANRKAGGFRGLGMRSPGSWPKLLATTLVYGVVIQVAFTVVIEPALGKLTGSEVDISAFDSMRGNVVVSLMMLAVGWIVGGFLEELTFRGFVMTRVRGALGSGSWVVWVAILAGCVPFGLAHFYQGPAGMITTGLIGFLLGVVYVRHEYNLWYSVFTHGFVNTVAMVLIYLDVDRDLGGLLY